MSVVSEKLPLRRFSSAGKPCDNGEKLSTSVEDTPTISRVHHLWGAIDIVD